MPQTPQEKAIHASSKSNGNSNEVTSASMVKDDEPDSNNGTTNEKKKSWKSKFGNRINIYSRFIDLHSNTN